MAMAFEGLTTVSRGEGDGLDYWDHPEVGTERDC